MCKRGSKQLVLKALCEHGQNMHNSQAEHAQTAQCRLPQDTNVMKLIGTCVDKGNSQGCGTTVHPEGQNTVGERTFQEETAPRFFRNRSVFSVFFPKICVSGKFDGFRRISTDFTFNSTDFDGFRRISTACPGTCPDHVRKHFFRVRAGFRLISCLANPSQKQTGPEQDTIAQTKQRREYKTAHAQPRW